jgi:hypothetical protein
MNRFIKSLKKIILKQFDLNDGELCNCSRNGITTTSSKHVFIEKCPLIDGYHTSCWVCKCKKCNGFYGVPSYNLDLMIDCGTIEVYEFLIEFGFNKTFLEERLLKRL